MSGTNGARNVQQQTTEVAIIGAGFAGLGMAIRLRQEGEENFVVFEAADRVGGTWRDNTYPGCGCDVPSHLYSYSFEPRPQWSRAYSPQQEILEYIEYCVAKNNLTPKIRFSTPIEKAEYDEVKQRWCLTSKAGEVFFARYLVAGTGPLAKPSYPNVPGRETFKGAQFHSARWDHDYDLKGKKVAVIGTGASAIQFVPAILPEVAELTLFQRTPPWIMPRPDRAYTEGEKERFARHPRLQRLYRNAIYWRMEATAMGLTVKPEWMKFVAKLGRKHINSQVEDPELRAKVTPDYLPGCKRILVSNNYYPALASPKANVVTDSIEAITEKGVRTANDEYEVDAILYGTGFAVTEFMADMKLVGRDGMELHDRWQKGIEAYYGMCVSGFPNFFILVGPNTGLGHNSIIFMIEAQVNWILRALKSTRRRGAGVLDVQEKVQRDFNGRIHQRLADSVWQSGCQSWYLDQNGHNFSLWPGFTVEYWARTQRFQPDHFRFEDRS